jgi:hypothetical protein
MKHTVTLVTSFLDLNEDRSKDKSVEKCFIFFQKLANTNIPICLFVSEGYLDRAREICEKNKNIYLMPVVNLEDTWTYKTTSSIDNIQLPNNRTDYHDTYNFIILMNSKIEFVNEAIKLNPFQTNHFAWIDFSICHVIKSDNTLERFKTYCSSLLKDKFIIFPACWPKEYVNQYTENLYNQVIWRFCGGFFIGDKDSLRDFNVCYQKYYKIFLEERKKLVWEVNFWAWLENKKYWNPESYMANHNDSILNIPSEYLKTYASLTTIPPRQERCKKAIRSLLNQVDHIYLSVSKKYKRFGEHPLPDFSNEPDFEGKVTVVESEDYGPATKYLGALTKIPESSWIFFCDDDQEYKENIIKNMKDSIHLLGAYQNRYEIVKNGSGGIIHGYVGNIIHRESLNKLNAFNLPECSRFVDDQWMSIYCFLNDVNIFPTKCILYEDIFSVLFNGYEQIGEESLASLSNRDSKVKEIADYFKVIFQANGKIVKKEN